MRKTPLLALLLLLVLVLALPGPTQAAQVTASGSCGTDATWTLDADGVLTVSGEGPIRGYSQAAPAPYQAYASQIKKLVIEAGITTVGTWAFAGLENLKAVSIADTVTEIGGRAFADCIGMTDLKLSAGLTVISSWAFSNCPGLTEIAIPVNVQTVGNYAFWKCTGLTRVEFLGPTATLKGWAFSRCWSLKNVILHEGLTTLEDHAFFDCVSLAQITFPASITQIGEDAFCQCTKLKHIYFLGDAPQLMHDCFELVLMAKVYYPQCNPTWQDSILQGYGGLLLWKPYMPAGAEHHYGDWTQTKAPACTEAGAEERTCHCGHTERREVAALGHTPGAAATCTASQTCAVCGAVLAEQLGHSYTEAVVAPTCTEPGSSTYTCHCGDTYTEELPALGHSEELDAAVAPTCTETGLTEGWHCAVCGEILTAQEELPAIGHSYVDEVCTNCGEPAYILGDVNGDGRVNARDARALLRYIASPEDGGEIDTVAADLTGDGRINARDARALLRLIAEQ